jgi:spermidine synthase
MARSYAAKARPERPRVRVDESGGQRTLVVDETFASFYRPGEIATRCVWDAIAAPILWLPPSRRRRILILGLGGGSIARLARALAPDAEIVGVELDPEVVRLARAHLDLDRLEIEVVVADAFEWLRTQARGGARATTRGAQRFDVILEDIFIGEGDAVHKPDWIPDPAHPLAWRLLEAGGVFVSNTLDEFGRVAASMGRAFGRLVAIGIEDYDNRVLVAADAGLGAGELRARVKADPVLGESLEILSFRSIRRAGR